MCGWGASLVAQRDCCEYALTNKVIREKSRGEGSLIVQDTIENVSEAEILTVLFVGSEF